MTALVSWYDSPDGLAGAVPCRNLLAIRVKLRGWQRVEIPLQEPGKGHNRMAENNNTRIELRKVTIRRDDRVVLQDLDMDIPEGRIIAVMGPSGSGKTTVLKAITGQLPTDGGSIRVGDQEVTGLSARGLKKMRRNIGMLLQNGALFTDLTSYDNVALPLREHTKLPETLIRKVVLTKLHAVGLRGAAQLYPRELSGGMNRRVALARALALDPGVMLYDEPFTGLDPISMGAAVRLIRQINRVLGITSVVVTHDVQEVPEFADYCYIIAEGRVAAEGTPDELDRNEHGVVHQFMHGLPDGPVPFHYPAPDYRRDLLEAI